MSYLEPGFLHGRRSGFPVQGVDKIIELFDLPHEQKANVQRYQILKTKSNLDTSEGLELNALVSTLQRYIIDVEKWNKFGDIVVNMQRFFIEDIEPYVEDMRTDITNHANTTKADTTLHADNAKADVTQFANTTKNQVADYTNTKMTDTTTYVDGLKVSLQGEVDKLTSRGEWSPTVQYYNKNIVTVAGEGYIAKQDNKGQTPSNPAYWTKIAAKGDKGEPSLNISYKGAYNAGMDYVIGDAVTYSGMWYYAKQATKGNLPTNAIYWEIQTNQTLVGSTPPFDDRVTLWINTNL